jgi:hypothetical protein
VFKPRDGQAHQVALAPINYYENHGERSSARCLIPKVLPTRRSIAGRSDAAERFQKKVQRHVLGKDYTGESWVPVLPLPVLQNVLAPCASLFRDLVSLHALASNSVNMSPVLQVQVPK